MLRNSRLSAVDRFDNTPVFANVVESSSFAGAAAQKGLAGATPRQHLSSRFVNNCKRRLHLQRSSSENSCVRLNCPNRSRPPTAASATSSQHHPFAHQIHSCPHPETGQYYAGTGMRPRRHGRRRHPRDANPIVPGMPKGPRIHDQAGVCSIPTCRRERRHGICFCRLPTPSGRSLSPSRPSRRRRPRQR